MGKYKEENGKTRLGKFVENLGEIGQPILEIASSLTGQEWLNKVSKLIISDKNIDIEKKQEAFEMYKLDIQDTQDARKNETSRDTSEHSSFLSKNIHELTIIVLVLMLAYSMFFKSDENHVNILVRFVEMIFIYLFGRSKPQK